MKILKIPIQNIGLDNTIFERKILNISLPISYNKCFGCSKEPSHQDGSFEWPQHMFWLRNKKKYSSLVRTLQLKAICFSGDV